MTETQITVTKAQRTLLYNIATASEKVLRCAESLAKQAAKMVEETKAGQHTWGVSHQLPYDLWQAEAERDALCSFAGTLFDTPEAKALVVRASTGAEAGWLWVELKVEGE